MVEAIRLYQRAVDLDDSGAMVNLSFCYQNGIGVDQNLVEAIRLSQQAVDLGESAAMINLGFCYQNGTGVDQNWNQAIDLYQRAINARDKRAIEFLQDILLLQNFLGEGNYKTRKIKGWPKNKFPHSTTAPTFDPPIMTGDWIQLTAKEIAVCLDKVITPFEILELVEKLDGYVGQYARRLPLSFYKDCDLVDIQLYNPSNKNAFIFSAVVNTEGAILLNRKANIIHGLNPYLLVFDAEKSTVD